MGSLLNLSSSALLAGKTDYSKMYLTFEARESGTFKNSSFATQYSTNGGATWNSLAANTNSPTIAAGDKIMWKATITPTSSAGSGTFSATGNFDVEGNAMSLLFGDNFVGQTSLSGKSYAFYKLFKTNTKIVNAENLIFPATTLSDTCYRESFQGCKSLVTIPRLPAKILAANCYRSMYIDCFSLVDIPFDYLPATTLADYCYKSMFGNCKNITKSPLLPAATLVYYCYEQMFIGCSLLENVTCLATDISASRCVGSWLNNTSATGTFIKASSMSSWPRTTSGIPSGWTVVDYTE